MIETFLALLAAHLVADFPLQPAALIRRKRNVFVLLAHAAIVALVSILLLGAAPPGLLAILVVSHVAMDALKTYGLPDTLWAFLLDQAVHLAVIAGLAVLYADAFAAGWWGGLPLIWQLVYLSGLTLLSGIIAALPAGAILIRKATAGFVTDIREPIDGLPDGGFYIGCLERALVMLLIFTGQPSGVGFLIAAKSILRFGDVKEPAQRKMTEYIIIGTFMSFGWGLLIAALTHAGVRYWLTGTSLAF